MGQNPTSNLLVSRANAIKHTGNSTPKVALSGAHGEGRLDSIQQDSLSLPIRWAKSFPTLITSSAVQHSCLLCNKTFTRRCDLNRHNKKHTRPYKCKECGKSFASRKDRDRHSNIWVHGQKTNYLCTMSGCLSSTADNDGLYAFSRVDRWRTHMIKKHGLSKEEVRAIVKRGIPVEEKKDWQADIDEVHDPPTSSA